MTVVFGFMISSVISVEVKHLFKTKIHHEQSWVKLFVTVPQEDINYRTDNSVISKDQVIVIVFGRVKGLWGTWQNRVGGGSCCISELLSGPTAKSAPCGCNAAVLG